MTTTTPARSASPGLSALSEDEFMLLIATGGTLTIRQVNTKLNGPLVNAELIFALGIDTRRHRTAVHIDASDFDLLVTQLASHVMRARQSPA